MEENLLQSSLKTPDTISIMETVNNQNPNTTTIIETTAKDESGVITETKR